MHGGWSRNNLACYCMYRVYVTPLSKVWVLCRPTVGANCWWLKRCRGEMINKATQYLYMATAQVPFRFQQRDRRQARYYCAFISELCRSSKHLTKPFEMLREMSVDVVKKYHCHQKCCGHTRCAVVQQASAKCSLHWNVQVLVTQFGHASFVPRPPRFFVLQFAFSIIHGSGRARKTGKAWSL